MWLRSFFILLSLLLHWSAQIFLLAACIWYKSIYIFFRSGFVIFIGLIRFLGENNPCKTDKLELLYREHKKGDTDEPHFHKSKIELVIILKGKIKFKVNDKVIVLKTGDYLFLDKNNIVSSEFLEPTKIFVIHSPSIPNDKTVVL